MPAVLKKNPDPFTAAEKKMLNSIGLLVREGRSKGRLNKHALAAQLATQLHTGHQAHTMDDLRAGLPIQQIISKVVGNGVVPGEVRKPGERSVRWVDKQETPVFKEEGMTAFYREVRAMLVSAGSSTRPAGLLMEALRELDPQCLVLSITADRMLETEEGPLSVTNTVYAVTNSGALYQEVVLIPRHRKALNRIAREVQGDQLIGEIIPELIPVLQASYLEVTAAAEAQRRELVSSVADPKFSDKVTAERVKLAAA